MVLGTVLCVNGSSWMDTFAADCVQLLAADMLLTQKRHQWHWVGPPAVLEMVLVSALLKKKKTMGKRFEGKMNASLNCFVICKSLQQQDVK